MADEETHARGGSTVPPPSSNSTTAVAPVSEGSLVMTLCDLLGEDEVTQSRLVLLWSAITSSPQLMSSAARCKSVSHVRLLVRLAEYQKKMDLRKLLDDDTGITEQERTQLHNFIDEMQEQQNGVVLLERMYNLQSIKREFSNHQQLLVKTTVTTSVTAQESRDKLFSDLVNNLLSVSEPTADKLADIVENGSPASKWLDSLCSILDESFPVPIPVSQESYDIVCAQLAPAFPSWCRQESGVIAQCLGPKVVTPFIQIQDLSREQGVASELSLKGEKLKPEAEGKVEVMFNCAITFIWDQFQRYFNKPNSAFQVSSTGTKQGETKPRVHSTESSPGNLPGRLSSPPASTGVDMKSPSCAINSGRGSRRSTSAKFSPLGSAFPDIFICAKQVNVISVELKSNRDEALSDLTRKSTFPQAFRKLWFHFGIAANCDEVQFVVLVNTKSEAKVWLGQHKEIYRLGPPLRYTVAYDVEKMIIRGINLLRIALALSEKYCFTQSKLPRRSAVISIVPSEGGAVNVWKYTTYSTERRHQILVKMYSSLASHTNKHLVRIRHIELALETPHNGTIRCLMNPCWEDTPTTPADLKEAIRAVLSALTTLHGSSVYHSDIRWPNIMRSCDGGHWVLVDLECAEIEVGQSLAWLTLHPPECLSGPKADMWYVGKLMLQMEKLLPPEGCELANKLASDNPEHRPTIEEALSNPYFMAELQPSRQYIDEEPHAHTKRPLNDTDETTRTTKYKKPRTTTSTPKPKNDS
ncbi:hypothetical protein Pelo_14522 [Pelomyxa schiedti]|nr:hypothetical protein Pelo_14522 [Pelomyxa schiedti]